MGMFIRMISLLCLSLTFGLVIRFCIYQTYYVYPALIPLPFIFALINSPYETSNPDNYHPWAAVELFRIYRLRAEPAEPVVAIRN